MAQLSDVLTFSRAQAQTDSNGLTNANGIIFANEALLDFRRRLITRGVDASQIQEAYTSSTANQGTYLYPTDFFFLKAIEVDWTGLGGDKYLKADQIDQSNLQNTSFSWLRVNQSAQFPLFADNGDWFEIFPTPLSAITNMFRIFYFLEPTEYTAVSDTIAYPESLDYRILGWKIVSAYWASLEKWDSVQGAEAEYEKRVEQLIKTLGRGTQQPTQATPIIATGWNF